MWLYIWCMDREGKFLVKTAAVPTRSLDLLLGPLVFRKQRRWSRFSNACPIVRDGAPNAWNNARGEGIQLKPLDKSNVNFPKQNIDAMLPQL